MTVWVYSYTIYDSPNAYLGTVLLRRALADMAWVELVRRPIYVPRERGLMIAELLGGKENRNARSYNREDCRRWSERFAIPFSYPDSGVFDERAARWAASPFDPEELPARAFYAADPEKRHLLDEALFEAAWVEGRDVNEPALYWRGQSRVRSALFWQGEGRLGDRPLPGCRSPNRHISVTSGSSATVIRPRCENRTVRGGTGRRLPNSP
jgi:2-hydroxychromene-2-carboxylate isomerase